MAGATAELLPDERRRRILDRLGRDGRVVATELATWLGVSEDTIRRDLRDLTRAGLAQRVHGGALPRSPAAAAFVQRRSQAPDAKRAIARAAATLVAPGQLVLMDGGTTTLEVARSLPADLRATIVTNSPPIAVALADHPSVEVMLLGGRLDKHAQVTVGADTAAQLRMFRPDLCLLGVCSLDPVLGITTLDPEEAPLKRTMIAQAAETVAVVTADKLGTAAPYVVGPLGDLAQIVVDLDPDDPRCVPYRAAGIHVVPADRN